MRTFATKITPMQKIFAQKVAKGMKSDKAYIESGYKGIKNPQINAFHLLQNRFVQAEIKKLQESSTKSTIATLEHCKEVLTKIIAEDKGTTKIKAIDQLAKLSAWQTQNTNVNVKTNVDDLSDEDLLDMI